MNTHAYKTQENKSQLVSAANSQMQSSGKSTFQFVDNRPDAIAQRKLQEMVNNSPKAKQAAQLQAIADNHSAQQQQPIIKKENNTGLSDNLKRTKNVIQRVLILNGKEYRPGSTIIFENDHDKETPNNILTALADGEPSYRAENISDVIDNGRRFYVDYNDQYKEYIASYSEREAIEVEGGRTRESGGRVLHVTRPDEGFEEITINGMLDCIGIVINAIDPETGKIIASSVTHFVTGQNTRQDGSLNPQGADILAEQFQIIERHGLTLSAIVMSAQGFGGMEPAPESAAGIGKRAALHVSNLIKGEGATVETVIGPGSRSYRLYSDGSGTLV